MRKIWALVLLSTVILAACASNPASMELPRDAVEAAEILLWEDKEIQTLYQSDSELVRFTILSSVLLGRGAACDADEQLRDRYTQRLVTRTAMLFESQEDKDRSSEIRRKVARKAVERQIRRGTVSCQLVLRMLDNPWF
jgi:hypothetical protein